MAASLFGSEVFGIKGLTDKPKMLFFDTEQAEADAAKVLRRVSDILGMSAKDLNDAFTVYALRSTDTRHRPVNPIRFAVDGHGTPCSANGVWGASEATKAAEQIEVMRKAFAESPALSYKELCNRVCEAANIKYDAARKRIEKMLRYGVILKDDETGLYKGSLCCEG